MRFNAFVNHISLYYRRNLLALLMMGDVKILSIGDPHFTIKSFHNVDCFLVELEKHLRNHKYDVIVMMGDLLHDHSHLQSQCLSKAFTFIEMLSNYSDCIVCIVGNHDATSNSLFLSTNHWMNCLKNKAKIKVIDEVTHLLISNNKQCTWISDSNAKKSSTLFQNLDTSNGSQISQLTFVPFCQDGRFYEALNLYDSKMWKSSDIIFAHQLLDGCKMGAIICENVEKWLCNDPLIISGHIHSKQVVQPNLYYCGSSMMHSFGEENDKSLLSITIENVSIGHKNRMLDSLSVSLPVSESNKTNNSMKPSSTASRTFPNINISDSRHVSFNEIVLDLWKKRILYLDLEQFKKIKVDSLEAKTQYKFSIRGYEHDFKSVKRLKLYKTLTDLNHKVIFKPSKVDLQNQRNQKNDKTLFEANTDPRTRFEKQLFSNLDKQKDEHNTSLHEKFISYCQSQIQRAEQS